MKIRKIYYSKEPEVQEDLSSFFEHISGGGSGDIEEAVQETLDTSEEGTDETDFDSTHPLSDPRDTEVSGEVVTDEDAVTDPEGISTDEPLYTQAMQELKDQNAKLMEIVNNTTKAPQEAVKPVNPEPDIFSGEEFTKVAEVLELDENERVVLSTYLQQMSEATARKAVQDAMSQAPQIVNSQITQANEARDMKKKFYAAHPSLEPVQDYVAQVANMIAQENPGLSVDEVLTKTAERSYSALGIDPKTIGKSAKAGKGKPAFAKAPKGSRKATPEKSKFENEIDAMLSIS